MLRKTLTTLSLIGLLLSVGLWGVSYMAIGIKVFRHALFATSGILAYERCLEEFDQPTYEDDLEHGRFRWVCLGEGCYLVSKKPPRYPTMWWFPNNSVTWQDGVDTGVHLPIWVLVVVWGTIFLSCRPLAHHRRRYRKKLGLCVGCGYNLRGLTEPRCPECNTPFEKCSAKP